MATSPRQRFKVNPSGSAQYDPSDSRSEIGDAWERAAEDFRKGLIDADEAMEEYVKSVRKYGRSAGMTAEGRERAADKFEERLDAIARGMSGARGKRVDGVTKDKIDTDDESRAKAEKTLLDEVNDALQKFKDGLITADEAAKRQAKAFDKNAEKAGMTVEDREAGQKKAFDRLSSNADFLGKESPEDPTSPMKSRFGKAFGKMGLPKGWGEKLGGLAGAWEPKGGMLGDLFGKKGLVSAIGSSGAGGGAAGLAGPLAIAAAAAKVMTGFYKGVSDVTRKLGDVGSSIAKNDGVGAITGFMDGIGEAYGKIPIVGEMLQAQIGMYTQFIKSFDQVTAAFEQRGKEISRFSGGIAAAEAQSKTTKLLADIREANNLSNEYSAIISERTEMQVEFQRALEPIKRIIMQDLVIALKFINFNLKAINTVNESSNRANQAIQAEMTKLVQIAAPQGEASKLAVQWLRKMLNMGDKPVVPLEQLFRMAERDLQIEKEFIPDPFEQPPLGIGIFDQMAR